MTLPPCKKDGIECPRRYNGCRTECKEYRKWMDAHAEESRRQHLDKTNPADAFLIDHKIRVKQAQHRDSMRGYVRK